MIADRDSVELALGCPFDPRSGMSLAGSLSADEQERVPTAAFDAAWGAGCHEYTVPVEDGGRLESFETLLAVVRAVSRRDLTVAVGLGSTMLASMPVWLWGDAAQRRRVAELVLAREFGTAAVSERGAGSDLLATVTRAVPTTDGFVLDGDKWLVGNGRRSAFATVLAASDPSFGLFVVDFAAVGERGVQRLPAVPTLGLRGHDLSGIRFDGCEIGADSALGQPGRGIEMVTGMLQFTRTMVGGLGLGAADTGLRLALRHARGRALYGRTARDLAPVRSLLARAMADLLIGECTALAAARGIDVAPHRMPLWSAVAKYIVPAMCTDALHGCAEVLSARAYVRDGITGTFQKVLRDAAIIPVFEGTQLVQLETIRAQLWSGIRRRGRTSTPLGELFGFGAPSVSRQLRLTRPPITYGGADEIVDQLDEAVERLAGDEDLAGPARSLLQARDRTRDGLNRLAGDRSARAVDLVRQHALVHAGACCLHTWVERRDALGGLAGDHAWLAVALHRILQRLNVQVEADERAEEDLVRWLEHLDDNDRAFSLIPSRLAPQYRDPTAAPT